MGMNRWMLLWLAIRKKCSSISIIIHKNNNSTYFWVEWGFCFVSFVFCKHSSCLHSHFFFLFLFFLFHFYLFYGLLFIGLLFIVEYLCFFVVVLMLFCFFHSFFSSTFFAFIFLSNKKITYVCLLLSILKDENWSALSLVKYCLDFNSSFQKKNWIESKKKNVAFHFVDKFHGKVKLEMSNVPQKLNFKQKMRILLN